MYLFQIMTFQLPPLPYSYDALEPIIDRETMQIHHTKHHQAYLDKLNAWLDSYPHYEWVSVSELLRTLDTLPDALQPIVRNHGGGHSNHSLFWKTLRSPRENNQPHGALLEALTTHFGSFGQFQEAFTNVALNHFGSGWAWLVKTTDNTLMVLSTANQDNPLMQGHTPLLGLDVWEHAYYLKYQNKRADYIQARWSLINWDEVSNLFEK